MTDFEGDAAEVPVEEFAGGGAMVPMAEPTLKGLGSVRRFLGGRLGEGLTCSRGQFGAG